MALPVGKVVTTVIRTWCRPAANRLVESAAKHQMVDTAILFIGRTYIRMQQSVARSEADVTKKVDDDKTSGSGDGQPLTPEQQAAENEYWSKVAQGLLPFRRARRRPKPPEPTEEEMRRAGAFVVVEAAVYGLMIGVVWWEYTSGSAEAKAKAEALEARFVSLEDRIAALQRDLEAERQRRVPPAGGFAGAGKDEEDSAAGVASAGKASAGSALSVSSKRTRELAAWGAMALLALVLGPFAG